MASKLETALDALSEACAKAHINLAGSEDGETVSALIRFTPGNKDEYIDAENAVLHVLAMVPAPRAGSVWGNDSGSVGGAVGLEQGYVRLTKSGCDKRIAKAVFARQAQLQYADVWSGAAKAGVTAGTQKKQVRKAKAEAAKADEFIDKARAKGKRTYSITADDIVAERDGKGLSWAQVAINLNLGSPGAARRAYTELTGRDHSTSQMTGKRAPRGSRAVARKLHSPEWNDDSDQDEIIEKLNGMWIEEQGDPSSKNYIPAHWSGSSITVKRQRTGYEEELRVRRVVNFTFGKNEDQPLQVTVIDDHSGAQRCFFVSEIIEVR